MKNTSFTKSDINHINKLWESNHKKEALKYIKENCNPGQQELKELLNVLKNNDRNVLHNTDSSSSQTLFLDHKKTKSKRVSFVIFILLSGIGFVLLLSSLYQFTERLIFLSNAKKIEAIIVKYDSYQSRSDNTTTTMYTPVFEFEMNGKMYNRKAKVSSSSREYVKGEEISLYISPEFPKNKKLFLDNSWEKYGLPTGLLIFGGFLIVIGYVARNMFSF
ncbi:uncharacterized protein DUF3592 [Aquimarina sp. MAR_2010_214]|uniref:DUF3592 domain-containing protein n=1 Tax=Aquimarina sp. MAR_2010_214 TaxID=1250026 RepID=UPI000C713BE8|nr:DUF3592 domain-containing protein [Aquimarina sp. MAR_2010_214]PKV48810.1 uncharacterized protein DUF3592 [Aquimarina sp. MAR_2010_214]